MKKRTPSRTDLDKKTPHEIVEEYGETYYVDASIKALETHDSSRNKRRRENDRKHEDRDIGRWGRK